MSDINDAQVERSTMLLGRNQAAMAERAFDAYNFGEGVAVAGVSGWEYYAAGHERSRQVYVENVNNEGKENPATRLGFTVRYDSQTGALVEARAENAYGSVFGCMPEGQMEKLNAEHLFGVEMVSSGSFFGAVVAVTDSVVVQNAGRGRVVGHEVGRFGGVLPSAGQVIDLTHKDGKVSFVVEPSKGLGTER